MGRKDPGQFRTRYYIMRVIGNAVTYSAYVPAASRIAPSDQTPSCADLPMKPQGPPITPAGMAALKARYDLLLGTERPAIVEIVSWAAGNGDRSEKRRLSLWPQEKCARSTASWRF